jgi:hypothetical protein
MVGAAVLAPKSISPLSSSSGSPGLAAVSTKCPIAPVVRLRPQPVYRGSLPRDQ